MVVHSDFIHDSSPITFTNVSHCLIHHFSSAIYRKRSDQVTRATAFEVQAKLSCGKPHTPGNPNALAVGQLGSSCAFAATIASQSTPPDPTGLGDKRRAGLRELHSTDSRAVPLPAQCRGMKRAARVWTSLLHHLPRPQHHHDQVPLVVVLKNDCLL